MVFIDYLPAVINSKKFSGRESVWFPQLVTVCLLHVKFKCGAANIGRQGDLQKKEKFSRQENYIWSANLIGSKTTSSTVSIIGVQMGCTPLDISGSLKDLHNSIIDLKNTCFLLRKPPFKLTNERSKTAILSYFHIDYRRKPLSASLASTILIRGVLLNG